MAAATPKPLIWMGDSLAILRGFSPTVQDEVGYALYVAQLGGKHLTAKPLKGLGSGVLEVISDHRGDTFRAVYTLRLPPVVYVLHAFQKKSKRGIATPKSDLDLIRQRLKRALKLNAQRERSNE